MIDLLLQLILPFILSAFVVIFITVVAEKYGTKVGGILGTLPTTIIVAFIFIALNKGVDFASRSVAVVPAEMGINLWFLLVLIVLVYRSLTIALAISFIFWSALSSILYYSNLTNIYISFIIFTISVVAIFLILEKVIKIKSQGKVKVKYTVPKILFRGVLTGFVITISVLLANIGEVLSGIFSVFPVIITSTMVITYYEHGPDFAAGIAKSMVFGCWSVMSYAVVIHFLYPIYGITVGSIAGFFISLIISIIILLLRNKIK
jgi:hypothetical protein